MAAKEDKISWRSIIDKEALKGAIPKTLKIRFLPSEFIINSKLEMKKLNNEEINTLIIQ